MADNQRAYVSLDRVFFKHRKSIAKLAGIKFYPYIGQKMGIQSTIESVWFDDGRIFIRTDTGAVHSRPLEAFPVLLEASPEQKSKFEIGLFGDDIHWEELDEDIHISSFLEKAEPDPDNTIARVFKRFPQLNVSEVARTIGINKSLLSRYIYGIKKPSKQRETQILDAIRSLGREMASI